jgi:hypothetical protein
VDWRVQKRPEEEEEIMGIACHGLSDCKSYKELEQMLDEAEERAEAWKAAALRIEEARDPDGVLTFPEWEVASHAADAALKAARALEQAPAAETATVADSSERVAAIKTQTRDQRDCMGGQ